MSKGSRVKLCRHGNRQFHSLGMAMRRAPARSARAAIGGNRPCWGHCCATCASGSACCGNRRYRDSCCGDIDDHINDVVVIIVAIQCCGHGCWINLDRDRWVIVIVRVFRHIIAPAAFTNHVCFAMFSSAVCFTTPSFNQSLGRRIPSEGEQRLKHGGRAAIR